MSRHGENIRKRTDGRWEGRYIEYYSSNGKACYRSVYGKTYAETKEKLKQCRKLCNKSTDNRITMEELFKEWLNMKKDTIKSSTTVTYSYFINKHFIPYFKNLKAMYVTNELIQNFILKNPNLSPKTICDMISLLIQIIRYGQSKRYINYFDFNSIIYPKSPNDELPVLKKSEFIRLVNYVQSNFKIQKMGILLSLFMGMRLGEICALQWEDINFLDEMSKPSNLKFIYEDIEYNSIKDLEDKLSGTILANEENKQKTFNIKWKWDYQTGSTDAEILANDLKDTKNAQEIINYTFNISITGTQVEPKA